MKLGKKTVLITGGTSGIGLELARQLLDRGNTVIITGRDQEKLDSAKHALPGVHNDALFDALFKASDRIRDDLLANDLLAKSEAEG